MSKEQTPISFLFCETNAPEFSDELDLICESYLVIANIMEQYAQAKVSEALQSSKDIQDRFDDICIISHSLLEQIEDFESIEGFDFELEKIMIKSIIDNSSFEK